MEKHAYDKAKECLSEHGLYMLQMDRYPGSGTLHTLSGAVQDYVKVFGPFAGLYELIGNWDDHWFFAQEGHITVDTGEGDLFIEDERHFEALLSVGAAYPDLVDSDRISRNRLRLLVADEEERYQIARDTFHPLLRHLHQQWLVPAYKAAVTDAWTDVHALFTRETRRS